MPPGGRMRRELARRRQERRETRWQRRWHVSPRLHLHPHYSVSILDDSSHGNGLQAAINRAIAGRWSDCCNYCTILAVSIWLGNNKSVQSSPLCRFSKLSIQTDICWQWISLWFFAGVRQLHAVSCGWRWELSGVFWNSYVYIRLIQYAQRFYVLEESNLPCGNKWSELNVKATKFGRFWSKLHE